MERVGQLLGLVQRRAKIIEDSLFNTYDDQVERFNKLSKEIEPLAESLSVFSIRSDVKGFVMLFDDVNVFNSFKSEAEIDKVKVTYGYKLHHRKTVVFEIGTVELVYIESVDEDEEHKKTQAI